MENPGRPLFGWLFFPPLPRERALIQYSPPRALLMPFGFENGNDFLFPLWTAFGMPAGRVGIFPPFGCGIIRGFRVCTGLFSKLAQNSCGNRAPLFS